MILSYEFDGASDNLGFFLNFYAKNLTHSFVKTDNKLTLLVNAKEDELAKFSDELGAKIPHFITLKDSQVYVTDTFSTNSLTFKNTLSNITPAQIIDYKKGTLSSCENGIFSDTSIFYDGEFKQINSENFDFFLDICIKNFKDNLKFKDSVWGEFELLPMKKNYAVSAVVPTNLLQLNEIFISNQSEKIALASYEKPAVHLIFQPDYRQIFNTISIDVVAPRDIFIYALCDKLSQNGVKLICIKARNIFKAVVLENDVIFANSQLYFDSKINSNDDFFSDKENYTLKLFLSKNYDDKIEILLNKTFVSILNLIIPRSFEEIYEAILQLDSGDKLLENYKKVFTLPSGRIVGKSSFFRLFCVVGKILNFHDDFVKSGEILLQNALDFGGTKGVRVEYKMASQTHFDVAKFVRSVMSFRLAGSDAKNLSFGIVENFIYFLSDIFQNTKDEIGLKNIILSGSLFESKTLSNLALKHLSLVAKTQFSSQRLLEV